MADIPFYKGQRHYLDSSWSATEATPSCTSRVLSWRGCSHRDASALEQAERLSHVDLMAVGTRFRAPAVATTSTTLQAVLLDAAERPFVAARGQALTLVLATARLVG